MNDSRVGDSPDTQLIASILSDVRQRRLLSILADQASPLTERDLAVQLAACELETRPSQVSEADRRAREVTLYHQKLPRLAAAGLIERTPAGISLVPWFPVDLGAYDVTVPPAADPEDPAWDLVAAVVKHPYRQHVVSLATEATDPIPLEDIASALAENDQYQSDVEASAYDRFVVRLHHVDLPKLDALGVVDYDHQERTVTSSQSVTPVQKG